MNKNKSNTNVMSLIEFKEKTIRAFFQNGKVTIDGKASIEQLESIIDMMKELQLKHREIES